MYICIHTYTYIYNLCIDLHMIPSPSHKTLPRMGWVPQEYPSTSYCILLDLVPLGISTHAMYILKSNSLRTTCSYIYACVYIYIYIYHPLYTPDTPSCYILCPYITYIHILSTCYISTIYARST